ncbi:MAG: hypothetical protein GY913_00010, partial [Proteobacteria bacterium]|nr:hypothetical protein [Pseudomonadota bacterium]
MGHMLERAAVEQDLALGPQALVDRDGLGEALGLEPGDVLLHALSVGAPPVMEDALVLAAASERNPQPAGEAFPVLADPVSRVQFKGAQHSVRLTGGVRIALPAHRSESEVESAWVQRRTFRTFSDAPVGIAQLGALLGRLRREVGGRAVYASPSDLYPVEVYVSVSANRVSGLSEGVYRYDPLVHGLFRLCDASLSVERFPSTNQAMASESAFALLLLASRGRIAPLYGEASALQCRLESGRISQVLEDAGLGAGLGLCQSGGFAFEGLSSTLGLSDDTVYVHALVGGVVDWSGHTRGWSFLAEAKPAFAPPPSGPSGEALRAHCQQTLPGYMVPPHIEVHHAFPLSANGKVDRAALCDWRAEQAVPSAPVSAPADGASDAQEAALVAQITAVAAEVLEESTVLPETVFWD